MTQRWAVERVVALATEPAQIAAGQRLATTASWSEAGSSDDPPALWGRCQGSGKTPYRTVVDLSGPAYNCSCPSRKFPCKHALGLMLLWSAGQLPDGAAPVDFARVWLTARAEKGKADAGSSSRRSGGTAGPAAAAKRAAQRGTRVAAGLDELDQWLGDQIRTGLAGLDRAGYAEIEMIAARMVDAQAPGVAGRLRRLPAVLASGEGWHARLLEQYALLRLLVRAHQRLAELPAPLAAAVRTQVGYPTSREDVLAGPGVRQTWAVLGRRDTIEDRLATRRVWLRGAENGRSALVLVFAPPGQQLDASLVPGTGLDADLHFYPGGIRALVGTRHSDPGLLPRLTAAGVSQALTEYGAALEADPWTASWPVLLDSVAPVREDGRWLLRADDGTALPLARSAGDPWRLLAVSGGEPVTVAGEWAADGFTPLSVVRRQDLVPLGDVADGGPARGSGADPGDWWDELAVCALLGTDRRPVTEFAFLPGRLGATAARLAGDPAAVLLDAAALAVGYRRGGVTAGTTTAEPDRAPADVLPLAGRQAAARLSDLLHDGDLELLMFWCATAAEAGSLAPGECLPDLLDLAAKQPLLRPAVARVLGERGRWLARRQPGWAKAFSAAAAADGDGPLDPQVWQLGTPAQRAGWLRAVRRSDPAAGAAALAGTWAGEPGPHRAVLLPVLAEGLGPADEALLEAALDDRRADVRAVAADLLAALPTSGYADRMRSRAKSFVHPERVLLRSRLVVDVPERLDPAAIRDGLTETRPGARMTADSRSQWWLEQVVAATPLSAWEQLFDTPQAAIAHRFDEPWQQAIHAGWAWAAVRQRNEDWAVVLLATRSRHRVEDLLSLLDGEVLASVLRRLLGRLGPADVQLLARYLDASTVPWPQPVAADVLAWLLSRLPVLHPRSAQPLLNQMSYRFPIASGPVVSGAADDLPLDDPWRSALRSVARLISIRTRIHEELQ